MNKHLIIIALCGMFGLCFASCSEKSVVGTWIEEHPEEYTLEESGFILYENGEMKGFNMSSREYHSWEKSGDIIYFKGTFTGNNPYDFVDTMTVVSIDDEKLLLEQGGYPLTYLRKK